MRFITNSSTRKAREVVIISVPKRPPNLRLVDPATASESVALALSKLPAINVFRAMANAETLYPYYIEYLLQLFKELELDKKLERMIVLRVSKESQCLYSWRQNTIVARSVGVSDEQIAAIERGDIKAPCFTPAQKVAFAFTDEAMQLIEVTELTYALTSKYFSDRAITEMLYVIGTYMFVARLVRSGRVPLDKEPAASPQ